MNDRASQEIMDAAGGNNMKYLMEMTSNFLSLFIGLFLGTAWLMGFVFAKGFWSTFWCWLPFYAWYLDLERLAQFLHWI